MLANLENSSVATGLVASFQRSVFITIPKKCNGKECSNYHTIALISLGVCVYVWVYRVKCISRDRKKELLNWNKIFL